MTKAKASSSRSARPSRCPISSLRALRAALTVLTPPAARRIRSPPLAPTPLASSWMSSVVKKIPQYVKRRRGGLGHLEALEKTFPEEWEKFVPREQEFFRNLWGQRTHSLWRVFRWTIKQQLGLLRLSVLKEVGPLKWLLYLPLQVILPIVLILATLRYPRLMTEFLADVRLYLDPKGIVEHTIVQRIDYVVGRGFLQLLGLNWDFIPLDKGDGLKAGSETVTFERVVWVAHSLGTVITFNVLSDLLYRACEIDELGVDDASTDEARSRIVEQKAGVERFRDSFKLLVTLGSPLEKAAFLFKSSLRPWPARAKAGFFDWVNFYHLLDPVSGRLRNTRLTGDHHPTNFHIRSGLIPGLAHVAYWRDKWTLRYILTRAYGPRALYDQDYRPLPTVVRWLIGGAAYLIWAGLLTSLALYAIVKIWPWILTGGAFGWEVLRL